MIELGVNFEGAELQLMPIGVFTRSTLEKLRMVLTVLNSEKRTESTLCLAASLKSKSHPAMYAAMTGSMLFLLTLITFLSSNPTFFHCQIYWQMSCHLLLVA